jgi:uncharacterized protein (TIGR03032 family)
MSFIVRQLGRPTRHTKEATMNAAQLAANSGPVLESREVRWTYSASLPTILAEAKCSLLVSTYQTGHVAVVSAPQGRLAVSFHTFERPMGLAVRPGWLVVGSRTQIWSLRNFPELAASIQPQGHHDACYLTRFSHFTGNIHAHELAWVAAREGQPEVWIVNTLFSCLCAASASYSFAPRWSPPFITALAPEDRCHLNGLAVAGETPRYVTALAETNTAQGWRTAKVGGGCVIDVLTNQIICRGLIMPHSPRLAGDRLLLLHSGLGQLVTLDPMTGKLETIAEFPGYTRGLAIHGDLAFVGLSTVRDSSSIDGVPIAARRHELKCGVAVVNLQTGQTIGAIDFVSGIDELFDVQILPGTSAPFISGPFADKGTDSPVWIVPPPGNG